MLHLPKERLEALGAAITVKETLGQPELWLDIFKEYLEKKAEVETFLNSIIARHGRVRVLFTGAGSSQYVGDVAMRSLIELGDLEHFSFESIGTTDIVSSPQSCLDTDMPTLLVSFARSGNSPESVAAVEIVGNLVKDSYHLLVTCAKDGELAKRGRSMPNALSLILPDASLDQGFAMTGSCSGMTLLATLVFSRESDEEKERQVKAASALASDVFKRENEIVSSLSGEIERVVYVGSGPLAALMRELQLKILELTAGKVATVFDSSMGLRHGPKSFVNAKTSVFVFAANQAYTRQYDLDVYAEVKADKIAEHVVLIGQNTSEGFVYEKNQPLLKEPYLVFPAFAFAHVIALNASILVENTPDTPSATGTVNRVVKGVTIYPIDKQKEE